MYARSVQQGKKKKKKKIKTCWILLFGVKVAHSQLDLLYNIHTLLGDFSSKFGSLRRASSLQINVLEACCSAKRYKEEVQKEKRGRVSSELRHSAEITGVRREQENETQKGKTQYNSFL